MVRAWAIVSLLPVVGHVLLFAQRVEEAPKLAAMEGIVVNARTREALRKTQVTLIPLGQPQQRGRMQPRRSTTTDSEGHFRFDKVTPGKYMVQAFRTGFIVGRTGNPQRPIELKSGEERRRVEVPLTPHSVIAGKVLDPEGEPLDQVSVSAVRVSDWGGGFRQMRPTMVTRTNDLGEFRLAGLTAGSYYVLASYPSGDGGPDAPFLQASGENYVPTFYPNSSSTGQASPVVVKMGEDVPGTVIKMSRQPVYRIAGRLTGLEPGTRGLRLMLMQDDKDAQRAGFYMEQPALVNLAERSFVFPSVPPGPYVVLAARLEAGGPALTLARVPVTVSYGDVDDLAVTLAPPVKLEGRIRVSSKEMDLSKVRVVLQVVDSPLDSTYELTVGDDGSFELDAVGREKHLLQLRNPPAGTYISEVRLSNEDALATGVDLMNASLLARLDIVLNTDPGTIEGFIANGEGRRVTLLPDPAAPNQPFRAQQTVADADGVFVFKDVAPGSYRVVAMDDITPDLVAEESLVTGLQNRGVRVTVSAGVVERIRLRVEDPVQ